MRKVKCIFLNNFILHFRDFQHTFINNTNFNNFLTNNSINNCFSASFNMSSLKVEHRYYAWAEKEWLSPRINIMAQCMAQHTSVKTTKVDKERYSTPALGRKSRVGGMLHMDDVTNILSLHSFNTIGNLKMAKLCFWPNINLWWSFLGNLSCLEGHW